MAAVICRAHIFASYYQARRAADFLAFCAMAEPKPKKTSHIFISVSTIRFKKLRHVSILSVWPYYNMHGTFC